MVNVVSFSQFANAFSAILLTLEGIVTLVSPLLLNAEELISL